MGDGVVGRAHDGDAGVHQPPVRLAQLVVRVTHLQADVVEPEPPAGGDGRRVRTHLDQQQFVVGAT